MSAQRMPSDVGAEADVLRACLELPDGFDRVSPIVKATDFTDTRHRAVFAAIESMEGRGANLRTVIATLREQGEIERIGGVGFVTSIVDSRLPDFARIELTAEIVRDASNRRRFAKEAQRIEAAATSGQPLADLAAAGMDLCSEIARSGYAGPDPVELVARKAIARLDERMTSGDPIGNNIATPLYGLNVVTNGIPRGVETILAARVRVGKTATALSCAIAAVENGKRVLLVELDMSPAMVGDRLLATVAGVSALKIRTGQGLRDDETAAIREAARTLGSWSDRLILDTRSRSIGAIAALIRREARSGGLDLVIIDHIGHIQGGRGDARYLQLGDVSARLIETVAETDVALLNLAQLGRDAEHREPTLSDLRESGNLEQDARVVLLLDRPHLRESVIPACRLNIIVAKNEGEAGHVIPAHFDLRRQRISDYASLSCAYCGTLERREFAA